MKKAITLILILAMAFALACINDPKPVENTPLPTTPALPTESPTEAPTATPEPTSVPGGTLSYDEIMKLIKIETIDDMNPRRIMMKIGNIKDIFAKKKRNAFVGACEILSTKYYTGWSSLKSYLEGYSIIEAKVIEVASEYNTAKVKPGDIITFWSGNFLMHRYKKDRYAFFSEYYNTPVENADDFSALRAKVYGYTELVPRSGEEYMFYIDIDDFPMKVGESYTLMASWYPSNNQIPKPFYSYDFIYPASYELDVAAFAKEHDFIYDDEYLATAKEIAALFRDPA